MPSGTTGTTWCGAVAAARACVSASPIGCWSIVPARHPQRPVSRRRQRRRHPQRLAARRGRSTWPRTRCRRRGHGQSAGPPAVARLAARHPQRLAPRTRCRRRGHGQSAGAPAVARLARSRPSSRCDWSLDAPPARCAPRSSPRRPSRRVRVRMRVRGLSRLAAPVDRLPVSQNNKKGKRKHDRTFTITNEYTSKNKTHTHWRRP